RASFETRPSGAPQDEEDLSTASKTYLLLRRSRSGRLEGRMACPRDPRRLWYRGEPAIGGAIMIGWRARLGFLVPPGNPTVEAEMMALAPVGVSLHFHRMAVGGGVPGALDNQDERTRTMIDSLDASVELLAMVKPDIIIVAHTATSYYLGRAREAELLARLNEAAGP